MTVMEYTAKFNELSRFAPLQVATKERSIDHLEQGFRGNVKSVLPGQTFQTFQNIYQRAVKVARTLKATDQENRADTSGKRKIEYGKWKQRRESRKR